ncbi:hypothetical protein AB0C60_25345, partial [Streptomyces sp. NPDC048845]
MACGTFTSVARHACGTCTARRTSWPWQETGRGALGGEDPRQGTARGKGTSRGRERLRHVTARGGRGPGAGEGPADPADLPPYALAQLVCTYSATAAAGDERSVLL